MTFQRGLLVLSFFVGLQMVACSQSEDTFSVAQNPDDGSTHSATDPWIEEKKFSYQGLFSIQALFVLDNSSSMVEELSDYINQRLATFMSGLNGIAGLSYNIAITDTNYNITSGTLISALNGQRIITKSSPANIFTEIFNVFTASVGTTSSGIERGLAAAAASIQQYQSQLFYPVASGVASSRRVVIISDADDTDSTPISAYTQPLKNVNGLTLHPIVALPGNPCSNPESESIGQRYVDAVAIVGGSAGSICRTDFPASLDNIFEWIQTTCIKLDTPVSSLSNVSVWFDGVQQVSNYQLDATRSQVCFSLGTQPVNIRVQASHY